jgi:hypothetical protein
MMLQVADVDRRVRTEQSAAAGPSAARTVARRDAARWFALAVGSLAVAGLSSAALVAGRVPGLGAVLVRDPGLARRSLVVHVNLAMGVWFFSCVAGLFCLLPGARRVRTAPVAVWLAAAGAAGFVVPMFFAGATPILSDYVPVLDNRLFLAGLGAFAAGTALNFADRRLLPAAAAAADSDLPPAAQHGVRAAAAAFVVALLTVAGAYVRSRGGGGASGMPPLVYFEELFWGGGHVLQVANTLGMLVSWLVLLHRLTGGGPRAAAVPQRLAVALFAALLLPALAGPWLTLGGHPGFWFTRMMQYGIFPAVSVFLVYAAGAVWRRRASLAAAGAFRTPAFVGLATSAAMTVAGFVLGGMIGVSNTLIPAHYHANIGAVTVAYMAALLTLMPRLGAGLAWPRLAAWQPLLFAAGQMTFALGLATAGSLGNAARKTYGAEQRLHSTAERVGLAMAGAGGAVALVGGTLFVALVAYAALRRKAGAVAPDPE